MKGLRTLDQRFRKALAGLPGAAAGPPGLLVAISGGADSMALLELSSRFRRLRVEAAHVDHALRGQASSRDRAWVEAACRARGITLHVRRATQAEVRSMREGDLERKARELRYTYFEEVRRTRGLDWIATGHHREDQIETFFLRLFRGAGPGGLAGMEPFDAGRRLVRPLLEQRPELLREALAQAGIGWREDGSNRSPAHDRNRLRRRILPAIRAAFGEGALDGVLRAMELLRVEEQAGEARSERLGDGFLPRPDGNLAVPADLLGALPKAVGRRWILGAITRMATGQGGEQRQLASLTRVDQILALAASGQSGRVVRFAGLTARRERGSIVLARDAVGRALRERTGETESDDGHWVGRTQRKGAKAQRRKGAEKC